MEEKLTLEKSNRTTDLDTIYLSYYSSCSIIEKRTPTLSITFL
jgi:hypothetical protein